MSEQKKPNWFSKINLNSIKQSILTLLQNFRGFVRLPFLFVKQFPILSIIFGFITVAIGCGFAAFIAYQQSILYLPNIGTGKRQNEFNPFPFKHPSNLGLTSKDIQIVTQDGVTLRGWHIIRPESDKLIVYFHGNAGNTGFRLQFIEELVKKTNSNVLLMGYRGYSDSDGKPSQIGLQKDSEAILQQAIKISIESKKMLYVFGTSLGGAVSIYVSGVEKIRQLITGLIVENTFTSTTDVLLYHAPFMKIFAPMLRLFNRNSWDSLNRINKIKRPIFFIKSGRDEVVPCYMTDKLRQECNKFHIHNYLYQLPNARHNDAYYANPNQYFGQLREFFKTYDENKNYVDKI